MGFIYADQGRSQVLGYEPGDVRAKERIGFLPENFAFYRYLNAEQLLQFHLRLSGRQLPDPGLLIADLLAKVKLDGYTGLKIGKYSRGMVQRHRDCASPARRPGTPGARRTDLRPGPSRTERGARPDFGAEG